MHSLRVAFALSMLVACSDSSSTSDPLAGPGASGGGMGTPAGSASIDRPGQPSATPSSPPGTPPNTPPAPVDGGGTDATVAPPEDPCPPLPIPAICHGRNVVYREWGASAVGDGTYFADQAPGRLGFNRTQNTIWVVKFKTEANTYQGRISAGGDASGGVFYISRDPCDPSSAIANKTAVWGSKGGGLIGFAVANDAADAAALKAMNNTSPQLKGGYCYYAVFQNTASVPQGVVDKAFIENSGDDCGASTGGVCYYLTFDMTHYLHTFSGQVMAGNVIPGLTK